MAGQVASRIGHLIEQLFDAGQAWFRATRHVGRLVAVTEDATLQISHGHVDARGAEICDQQVAGIRPEADPTRWPTAGARSDVLLEHEPKVEQLADALRDDAAGQARSGHELRP